MKGISKIKYLWLGQYGNVDKNEVLDGMYPVDSFIKKKRWRGHSSS